MSYILDALRRAQAERSRGEVPGLHSPAPPVAELPAARASTAGPGPWLLAARLLALGLGGAGWWLGRATPRPPAAAPAASAPPAAGGPAPGAVALAPAPPPLLTEPPPVLPVAEPPAPQPAPRPVARERAKAPPSPAAVAATPGPAAAPAPPAAAPAPAPAAPGPTEGTVFAAADLPPAVRAQLPTLQLAGITYSANPRHRMAIVNGQVLHEGE